MEIGFEGVSLRNGTFIQVMNVPQVDRAVEVNLKGEDEPVALEFWNAAKTSKPTNRSNWT